MSVFDFEKFTLGSLMHDIGKLKQRAQLPEDKGKTHSIIGYEWLSAHYGEGIISAAARDHHGVEKETWDSNLSLIIYEADNLAASERKGFDPKQDGEQTWQRDLLLASVFSRISLEEEGKVIPKSRYWPLSALGNWVEPVESAVDKTGSGYQPLWAGFVKDFEWLEKKGAHLAVGPILHLLEKYVSFVPSMTLQTKGPDEVDNLRKQQDISLFDHTKITAAVAGCLSIYMKENYSSRWDQEILKDEITRGWEEGTALLPFFLIGGDLSGVQRFLYTISAKGALKSLKGRSFYLELLTDFVFDRLLKAIGLTCCNVIYQGGGHFYLLGPNLKTTEEALAKVRGEVNDYLFDSFNGAILQLIEWVPMGKPHFRDTSDLWTELIARLNGAKKKKWADRIDRIFEEPKMPHPDCLKRNCSVCGREDKGLSDGEVQMCPTCREQYEFGEKLQRISRGEDQAAGKRPAIAVWADQPSGEGVLSIGAADNCLYYRPILLGERDQNDMQDIRTIHLLNEWDMKKILDINYHSVSAGLHHPKDFEDLESYIEDGFGWNKAAVLRMDVDRLGEIFQRGLPKGDRTFSRMASLSRYFSLFFKYHLNGILGPPENGYQTLNRTNLANRGITERGLSLVYSGGDDLFLIGRWLDVLEASFDIRQAFSRFTGNPAITLSAGYSMEAPQHPIYRFAKGAGEAEEKAKANGRDSVCVGNIPYRWNEAGGVLRIVREQIRPLLQTGESSLLIPESSFSKGFLYRLLALVREFGKEKMWIFPKMAYVAGRNGPNTKWLGENRPAAEAWMQLKDRLFRLPDEKNLQMLENAIVWVLMMMRKGGKE